MRITCKNCGGDHPVWDCKRPASKSTAARKDVQGLASLDTSSHRASDVANEEAGKPTALSSGWETKSRNAKVAGTQALPVDTNSPAMASEQGGQGSSPDTLGRVITPGTPVKAGYAKAEHRVAPETVLVSNPTPATKFDKKSWQREYMRGYMQKYRAALKVKQ